MMPFNSPPSARDNHPHDRPSAVIAVAALASIGSSAIVALAYWLGAAWLSESAFGLPAGVWIVVLLTAWSARIERQRSARSAITRPRVREPISDQSNISAGSRVSGLRAHALRRAAASGLDWIIRAIGTVDVWLAGTPIGGLGLGEQWRAGVARRMGMLGLPAAGLRIGFAMPREKAQTIIDHDPASADWFMLPRGGDPRDAASLHGLDALLVEPAPGVLRIATIERADADAAWFDWSQRRPLSYESVFPMRIDPSHITMDLSSDGDVRHSADIIAELTRAAAVWSRHPARLAPQDHILGRRLASESPEPTGDIELFRAPASPLSATMIRLAECLAHRGGANRPTAADRAAARALSAWVSMWDECIRDDQRRQWSELCARILPEEPEVMLRLAAVRLSSFDDEMGIAALRDADAMLQLHPGLCVADPVAFLQAELEHGPENPMTLGRVSAGLCLALAGVPTEQLVFLQEDLLDDMRFATWLVGRDQDRALLIRVMQDLREARERREAMASVSPSAQAA